MCLLSPNTKHTVDDTSLISAHLYADFWQFEVERVPYLVRNCLMVNKNPNQQKRREVGWVL